MCQQYLLSLMDQNEDSRYHWRIACIAASRTAALPTHGKWPVRRSAGRAVTAVVLPMQNLGGIARCAVSRVVALSEKRTQPQCAPSLRNRLLCAYFTRHARHAINGSHIERAVRLYPGN